MSGAPLVYYLSNSTLPSRDANAVQVARMCAAMVRQGARVELHCRWGEGARDADSVLGHYGLAERFELRGIALPRIPVVGRMLRSLIVLLRLGLAPRPDLLYGRDAYVLALVALFRFPRAPIVYEVHRPPKNGLEHWLQRTVFKSRRFARVVVISQALEREYQRLFGGELKGRITLARDGSDPAISDDPSSASEAGERLSVGYVGSLVPGKGMELIARLAPEMPDCDFHVIGGSPEQVEQWSPKASDNLTLHGFAAPEVARAQLSRFDVLLAPYQEQVLVGRKGVDVARWMSPLKIFEYMAAAKAIVASDLPALTEFLRDGENALLAPAGDVQAWAACIRRLRDDRQLRERVGARGLKEFLADYTWDRRAERVLDCGLEGGWARS